MGSLWPLLTPHGTQHVPKDVLDAAHQVLVQVLHHALEVPACQDNHLLGVVLQPLGDLCEHVLGGGGVKCVKGMNSMVINGN